MIGWEKSFPLIKGAQKNYCLVHLPDWTRICFLPFSGRILPSLYSQYGKISSSVCLSRICYCGFGCSLWIIANSYNFTLTPFFNVFIDLSIINQVSAWCQVMSWSLFPMALHLSCPRASFSYHVELRKNPSICFLSLLCWSFPQWVSLH